MECEPADPQLPLRQGDIVAAQPRTAAWENPWTRFGVIITADCDIAHRKSGPELVYVPIISHLAYISDVWLPSSAADLAQRGRDALDKRLRDLDSRLEYRHVAGWAKLGGTEEIGRQLQAKLISPRADIDATIESEIITIWNAISALESLSGRPATTQVANVRKLLETYVTKGASFSTNLVSEKSMRALIDSALQSLQDRLDTALIRELIGLDGDMTDPSAFGYIVPLRRFSLLGIDCIETGRAQWYGRDDKYLRICKLRPAYRFDLVQKFANLFMRVGLEDYRMDDHRRAFKRSSEALFPLEPKK
jgi:hypothetical protein